MDLNVLHVLCALSGAAAFAPSRQAGYRQRVGEVISSRCRLHRNGRRYGRTKENSFAESLRR